MLLLGYANHPGAAKALMVAQCWVIPILFSALFLGGLWQAKRLRKTTRFRSEYGYGFRFSALTALVSFTLAVLMFGAGNMAEAALTPPPPGGIGLGTLFYHANHLGTSSVITDESGVVKSRIIYKPYGGIDGDKSAGENLTPYKFRDDLDQDGISEELDHEVLHLTAQELRMSATRPAVIRRRSAPAGDLPGIDNDAVRPALFGALPCGPHRCLARLWCRLKTCWDSGTAPSTLRLLLRRSQNDLPTPSLFVIGRVPSQRRSRIT